MDAIKQRRLIAETEMFSLLESSDDELIAADLALSPASAGAFDGIVPPGTFVELVRRGWMQSATIAIHDEPSCVLFFRQNDLGWLTVEGAAALKFSPLKTLFEAVDTLARHLECKAIQYVTRFAALYKYGLGQGYKSAGCILLKEVKCTG